MKTQRSLAFHARRTAMLAAVGCLCLLSPAVVAAQEDHDAAFARELGLSIPAPTEFGTAIALAEMGTLRGGFLTASGIDVRFGFDIATLAADIPVQRFVLPRNESQMTVTNMGPGGVTESWTVPVTPGSVNTGPLSPPVEAVLGDGATRIGTSFDGGITTVIANTVNGQNLRRVATFDIELIGLRARLSQSVTHDALLSALSAPRVLRR